MNDVKIDLNASETTILQKISTERKKGIKNGTIPEWFVTPSYQMFKNKYVFEGQTVKDTYERIARCAASHMINDQSDKDWFKIFFDLMWKGWLSLSTPVLANMGTGRGCNVSCSGGVIGDSIHSMYNVQLQTALLTKNGFGTSAYLGDIRPRGSKISAGGHASGVFPVFRDYVQLSKDVSQGSVRRGAWAGYLDIDHKDFDEISDQLLADHDSWNVGWNISDNFIDRLMNEDPDAVRRYQKSLYVKCITGKGYYFFVDRANAANPPMYKDHNLSVKSSNLCTEIMLHADENHTFTCVLSSMNVAKFDEWKDTDAVYHATIFLDCVAQEFIEMGQNIRGLENAVRFTEKSRALGLGVLGFHTYLQEKGLAYDSVMGRAYNIQIFEHLQKESIRASKWMSELWDPPEWCKGYGVHNTHLIAIAPTVSTSLIMGGVSRGIEPIVENVYKEFSAAGEIKRINPTLLKIMKARNKYNKQILDDIIDNSGSVQHVDWLSDDEKLVFRTAFEISQESLIQMASKRQPYIDQGQSLNLFFVANEKEERISKIHKLAFLDKNIKSLYYLRGRAGVQASKENACVACAD